MASLLHFLQLSFSSFQLFFDSQLPFLFFFSLISLFSLLLLPPPLLFFFFPISN